MARMPIIIALALLAAGAGLMGGEWNLAAFLAFNHGASVLPATLWSCLTLLGDTHVALVLLAGMLWRRPQVFIDFALLLPMSGLVVSVFKRLIESPRPAGLLDQTSFQIIGPVLQVNSFPSGHTFTAFAIAAILIVPERSRWVWLAGVLLAVSVALSRLAVGAHWPADVLAGAGIGWLCGTAAHALGGKTIQRFPNVLSAKMVAAFAAIWLGLSLNLLRIDTAHPLADPFKWLVAALGAATCIAYLARYRSSRR